MAACPDGVRPPLGSEDAALCPDGWRAPPQPPSLSRRGTGVCRAVDQQVQTDRRPSRRLRFLLSAQAVPEDRGPEVTRAPGSTLSVPGS